MLQQLTVLVELEVGGELDFFQETSDSILHVGKVELIGAFHYPLEASEHTSYLGSKS